MRSVLKALLDTLVRGWAKIYSFRANEKARCMLDYAYCQWLKSAFASAQDGFHVMRPVYLKGGKNISIGKNFSACPRLRMEVWSTTQYPEGRIIIGDNVCFNFDCHIGAIDRITIGNNVLIGSHVLITDHAHGETAPGSLSMSPSQRPLTSKGEVTIGDDVWIGEGAAILSGVTIGRGAVIGANAVVTRNVPPYAVVGGIPARILNEKDLEEK